MRAQLTPAVLAASAFTVLAFAQVALAQPVPTVGTTPAGSGGAHNKKQKRFHKRPPRKNGP